MVFEFGGSTEAADYASEWVRLLKAGGWSLVDENAHSFMEGGSPWSGTHIEIKGTYENPGGKPAYDESSPEGAFIGCFRGLRMPDPTQVVLKPDIPENRVNILVGPRQ